MCKFNIIHNLNLESFHCVKLYLKEICSISVTAVFCTLYLLMVYRGQLPIEISA